MSYTPTTWSSGDTITAEKLNKIEQGITNSGPLTVHMNYNAQDEIYTLDKTWLEIYNAVISVGVNMYTLIEDGDEYEIAVVDLQGIAFQNNQYHVYTSGIDFIADTQNDYPSAEQIK